MNRTGSLTANASRRVLAILTVSAALFLLIPGTGMAQEDDGSEGLTKWENYAAQAWRDFQGGNVHEAFKKIKIAYTAAPGNERVKRLYDMISAEKERIIKRYVALGDSFYAQKKFNEALEAYSFAMEVDPHNPLLLSRINRLNNQAVEYGGDFLKLIDTRSKDLDATPGVANLDADIAIDLSSASRKTSSKADLYRAREYLNKGQLRDALVLFKEILAREPGNESVARVVKNLEERLSLADNLGKAESHYSAGRYAEAAGLYKAVEARFGLSPRQAARFAECLVHAGDLAGADEILVKHCPDGAVDPALTMTRAMISSSRGDYAQAARSFRLLWEMGFEAEKNKDAYYSNFLKAFWIRLAVAMVLGLAGAVLLLLGGLVERDSGASPWTLVAQAALKHERRDLKGAEELLGQAIASCPPGLDPELFAVASNNLGVIMLEIGRPKEAESKFLGAIRGWPDFSEARFNLGVTLMSNHETEKEAIDNFRAALALTLRDGFFGGLQRIFPLGKPVSTGTRPGVAVSELFILARETLKRGKLG